VYLDDLRLLQENDAATMKALLLALGDSAAVFLLRKAEVADTAVTDEGKTSFTLKGGTLVVGGEMLEWPDTGLVIAEWTDPIYLCVKEMEGETRTFEDGQDRSCTTERTVYATTDASGATESYNLYDLKTLGELLKSVIGYTEYAWKSVNVKWQNGYSGTVQYQDRPECYRVWIKAKSTNFTELTGSVSLFYVDYSAYRWLSVFESDRRAFVDSENGVTGFYISAFEGSVFANASLPFDDVTNAASLPINAIFEIPK